MASRRSVVANHAFDECRHFVETPVRRRHQAILVARELRGRQEVGHERLAEDETAGADHCHFRHGSFLGVEREIKRVCLSREYYMSRRW
jgi:hypothetical protein